MTRKKATYKEMMNYLDQTNLRIENNQRAVYDLSQVFSDYVEMHKDGDKLNDYMKEKHSSDGSGLDAGIPTHWSVFCKFFRNRYLKLKKILAFKK
jgi:hypothetical protein